MSLISEGSDVSLLGLISCGVGRYIDTSICCDIDLDGSGNISLLSCIFGFISLSDDDSLILDSCLSCILLLLLFLFNLHLLCLGRWLIEVVVHDSKVRVRVDFLSSGSIVNLEHVWLEFFFFVCSIFLDLSIENLLFVIGNNFNKFVFF